MPASTLPRRRRYPPHAVIKTRDEIELLKQASSIGDAAMWRIKHEWLKPGVREREIEAKVHEFMLNEVARLFTTSLWRPGAILALIAAGQQRRSSVKVTW